jgi:hypothetical protein
MGRPRAHGDAAANDQQREHTSVATPSRPRRAAAEDTKARLAGRLPPPPSLPPPLVAQSATPKKANGLGDAVHGKSKDQSECMVQHSCLQSKWGVAHTAANACSAAKPAGSPAVRVVPSHHCHRTRSILCCLPH